MLFDHVKRKSNHFILIRLQEIDCNIAKWKEPTILYHQTMFAVLAHGVACNVLSSNAAISMGNVGFETKGPENGFQLVNVKSKTALNAQTI